VLFDAAGIDWQYEVEGFHLNGARYLPDFFLPELKTYVEIKPTKEAAEQAAPLLLALKEASGCNAMFGIGSPAAEPPDNFFWCWRRYDGSPAVCRARPAQCPLLQPTGIQRDTPGHLRGHRGRGAAMAAVAPAGSPAARARRGPARTL
jgi:hypothetical protein